MLLVKLAHFCKLYFQYLSSHVRKFVTYEEVSPVAECCSTIERHL